MKRPSRKATRLIRIAMSLVGLGVIGWLIRAAGVYEVLGTVARGAIWLPVAVLFEAGRIGSELMATRALLGSHRVRVGPLVRAQLVANALCTLLPAGRAASEAAKASLLSRYVGGARAAVVAVESQLLNLICNAAMSGVVLLVVCAGGSSATIAWAVAVNALLCGALAVAIALGVRSSSLSSRLVRWPRISAGLDRFRCVLQGRSLTPPIPMAWYLVARVMQLGLWTVLLHAVGTEVRSVTPFVAQGLSMVAATMGDFVPAQLGAHDGVFAVASSELGVSLAAAVTATTLFHGVQLLWAGAGVFAAARPAPLHGGAMKGALSSASR